MELVNSGWLVSLCPLLALFLLLSILSFKLLKNGWNQRPPGPPGWPIVGNIFDLGPIPHKALYELRPKYGPLIWLKLFSVNTLVVQSAKAAAELFKNHDTAFSDRACPHALTAEGYNLGSMAIGSYGHHWRLLRRLCSAELFATKKIAETASVRRKCVDDMVHGMESESGEIDLWQFLFVMSFNVIGNMVFSRDLVGPDSAEGGEFFEALSGVAELAATPNVADMVPWLRWVDPQGLKKKMTRSIRQAFKVVSGFAAEKIEEENKSETRKNDFLNALLEYRHNNTKQDSQYMSEHNMKIIVTELFFAGTETTSSSIEWTMTELLRHPEKMRKAKEELDQVLGPDSKMEERIDELPYLQAVVKESLRLHPVLPLLLPRKTSEDTNYMGYVIPKNTQVLVNAWAIGRDPDAWDEPLLFEPERFLGSHSDISYKGRNYELIPFGAGRRICVGLPLAHAMLHHVVGTMLHRFDWELGDGVVPESIDMNYKMGLSARKLVPLKVIPKKRSCE